MAGTGFASPTSRLVEESVKGPRNPLLAVIFMFAFSALGFASAANVYITPDGSSQGACTTNPQPPAWFNSSSNWGSNSSQIGPGTTVHLCGAITTNLSVHGSGTNGHVIEVLAESGASVQIPNGNGGCPITVNNNNYLLFDGGGAGGTNGILAVLNNGSGLATQSLVSAFCNSSSSGNVEIRNWYLGPFYQHTDPNDNTASADTSTNAFAANALSGDLSIHDNLIIDAGTPVQLLASISNNPTIEIYNNNMSRYNWAIGFAPASGGAFTLKIHDNHFGGTGNWGTNDDKYHHNGIHFFAGDAINATFIGVYNNLFDGDWGTCCVTAFIYEEFSNLANTYFFNNVFNQQGNDPTNPFPHLVLSTQPGGIYNNTFQCGGGTSAGTQAIRTGAASSSMNIENNVFYSCNQFLTYNSTAVTGTVDYNVYMVQGSGGNSAWGLSGGGHNPPISGWQSACSCDSHSNYFSSDTLNPDGTPTSSFPGLSTGSNPGTNLTSIATGNLAALASDTSAGDTHTPSPRPGSGNWSVGAFESDSSGGQPSPPTGLSAIVN